MWRFLYTLLKKLHPSCALDGPDAFCDRCGCGMVQGPPDVWFCPECGAVIEFE
jgi:hypothetical protein